MPEPANIPTPPAWDFTDEGLRIWKDGEPCGTIPRHALANLTLDIIKDMQKGTRNDRP